MVCIFSHSNKHVFLAGVWYVVLFAHHITLKLPLRIFDHLLTHISLKVPIYHSGDPNLFHKDKSIRY